jgi:hypothetical protein
VPLPAAYESGVIASGSSDGSSDGSTEGSTDGSSDIEGWLVVDDVLAGAAACGKGLREGRACCSSAGTDVALSSRCRDGGVVAPESAIWPEAGVVRFNW